MRMMELMNVKASSQNQSINTLSGGNQQKVLLGRWLFQKSKVLILDEPTRGIDVGAKSEIYQHINRLAQQGLAIIVIWHGRKFCVSDFRQTQEYHSYNVHNRANTPCPPLSPSGWNGMRAGTA